MSRIESGIRNDDGLFDVAPPGLPARNSLFPALTGWANEFRRLRRLGAEAFRAWRETLSKATGPVSRSGIPPGLISKRWQRDDEGELLEEIQAATPERELSSPGLMRSLPPPTAEGGGIH